MNVHQPNNIGNMANERLRVNPANMEQITAVNVHPVSSGVIVEFIGRDGDGEVSVRSHELVNPPDEDDRVLRPQGNLPRTEYGRIADRLTEFGYELRVPERVST